MTGKEGENSKGIWKLLSGKMARPFRPLDLSLKKQING